MVGALYPTFAFLGFLLPLLCLPAHLDARNAGTVFYILWSSLGSFNLFLNALLWRGTTADRAPVWCEISIRIIAALNAAIPACSLAIYRRLYNAVRIQSVLTTRAEKRRALLIDIGICLIFPLITVILEYIVQDHRYNLFEDFGPHLSFAHTWPAFIVAYPWPTLVGLITSVYCILTLRHLYRARAQLAHLPRHTAHLSRARYARLMVLATSETLCTTPLALAALVGNARTPLQPWVSWAHTHADYGLVGRVPATVWRADLRSAQAIDFLRWSTVACALLFVVLFGTAREVRAVYVRACRRVARRLGFNIREDTLASTMLAPHQHLTPSLKDIDAMLDTAQPGARLGTHSEDPNHAGPAPPAPTHLRRASSFSTSSSATHRLAPAPVHDLPSNLFGGGSTHECVGHALCTRTESTIAPLAGAESAVRFDVARVVRTDEDLEIGFTQYGLTAVSPANRGFAVPLVPEVHEGA